MFRGCRVVRYESHQCDAPLGPVRETAEEAGDDIIAEAKARWPQPRVFPAEDLAYHTFLGECRIRAWPPAL